MEDTLPVWQKVKERAAVDHWFCGVFNTSVPFRNAVFEVCAICHMWSKTVKGKMRTCIGITGASQKIWISWKSYFVFLLISKSETFIYSRFITSKVKHFKSVFFLFFFYDIRAYSSLKSKIQYLKILEYFLRSLKKRICKTEVQVLWSMFIYALNTWSGLL